MESQPQNPEFRINPENFHPCSMPIHVLQYVIHAQKPSCTHLSFGTYVQKRRVIFVHA